MCRLAVLCVDWQYSVTNRIGHTTVALVRESEVRMSPSSNSPQFITMCTCAINLPALKCKFLKPLTIFSHILLCVPSYRCQRACPDIIFCLQPSLRSTTPALLVSIGFFRKDPGPFEALSAPCLRLHSDPVLPFLHWTDFSNSNYT